MFSRGALGRNFLGQFALAGGNYVEELAGQSSIAVASTMLVSAVASLHAIAAVAVAASMTVTRTVALAGTGIVPILGTMRTSQLHGVSARALIVAAASFHLRWRFFAWGEPARLIVVDPVPREITVDRSAELFREIAVEARPREIHVQPRSRFIAVERDADDLPASSGDRSI